MSGLLTPLVLVEILGCAACRGQQVQTFVSKRPFRCLHTDDKLADFRVVCEEMRRYIICDALFAFFIIMQKVESIYL